MQQQLEINQAITIKEIDCTINLKIKYYSNQQGKIVGKKAINNTQYIYLIEFFNYNRIWVIEDEITKVIN